MDRQGRPHAGDGKAAGRVVLVTAGDLRDVPTDFTYVLHHLAWRVAW